MKGWLFIGRRQSAGADCDQKWVLCPERNIGLDK